MECAARFQIAFWRRKRPATGGIATFTTCGNQMTDERPYFNSEDDCWYDAKGLQWTLIGPAPTPNPNYVYEPGAHFVEFSGGAMAWVTEHGVYGNDEAVQQFGIKTTASATGKVNISGFQSLP